MGLLVGEFSEPESPLCACLLRISPINVSRACSQSSTDTFGDDENPQSRLKRPPAFLALVQNGGRSVTSGGPRAFPKKAEARRAPSTKMAAPASAALRRCAVPEGGAGRAPGEKMSAPVQGGGSPQGPPASVRRRWEMARAGAPAGLASNPGVDVARRGLKVRNTFTALAIGAVVLGIYGYTFYSVSQERFLDELELEAKVVRAQAAKTSVDRG
ncbi:cytochrome c oxidase assembly factor 3 homolog, mitochondrial [Tiliqua scincoides]|uniref:cytochrome c oxidase assembly factor 3 homolog, mitochondrial n=1 Tax=Tiliqua scincoides TaxID=71010 RepID=UPI00346236E0